jgi:cytochrome P450
MRLTVRHESQGKSIGVSWSCHAGPTEAHGALHAKGRSRGEPRWEEIGLGYDDAPWHTRALVTSREDVEKALRQPAEMSSRFGDLSNPIDSDAAQALRRVQAAGMPIVSTLINEDGTRHRVFRAIATKLTSATRVRELEPRLRVETQTRLRELCSERSVDLVSEFSEWVPARGLCLLLGLSQGSEKVLVGWTASATRIVGREVSLNERLEAQRSNLEYQRFLSDQLARARVEGSGHPLHVW